MAIEHLVISGGSNTGFLFFGVLKHLIAESFLNIEDIKSIYCTSVGTLVALFFTLKYDLHEVETFLLERPWEDLYKVDFNTIVRAIQEGGMFGRDTFAQTIKPLLLGKDLSLEITLEDFFQYNMVDIHFFTTEYGLLELIDISHTTHPTWTLIDAIHASCALPILIDPSFTNGKYYVDGAVLKNYPLYECLENVKDPSTILGLYHNTNKQVKELRVSKPFLDSNTNNRLFEYLYSFCLKLWTIIKHSKKHAELEVPNQIGVLCDTSFSNIIESFQSKFERQRLLSKGVEEASIFLHHRRSNPE